MDICRACQNLVALAALAASAPAAADVTGPWLVQTEWTPKFKYEMICGLTQKGRVVTGPCMAGISTERAWGTLDANRLELEYVTVYLGADVDTRYHGVIDSSGDVSGLVDARQTHGQFDGVLLGEKGPVTSWKLHVDLGAFDFQMLCAMRLKGRL